MFDPSTDVLGSMEDQAMFGALLLQQCQAVDGGGGGKPSVQAVDK